MFNITIKNMLKDKLVTVSLILGILLSIAIVSSIPIYTTGILNKLLHDNFINYEATAKNESKAQNEDDSKKTTDVKENSQVKGYPSAYSATFNDIKYNATYSSFIKDYRESEKLFYGLTDEIKAPIDAKKTTISLQNIEFQYESLDNKHEVAKNELVSITDLMNHIKIIKGKKPSDKIGNDKVLEVMVNEETFSNFNMSIGKIYTLMSNGNSNPFKIKITGIFQTNGDVYWSDKATDFYCKLVVTPDVFLNLLKTDESYFSYFKNVNYKIVYDYNKIQYKNVDKIYDKLISVTKTLENKNNSFQIDTAMRLNLESYIKNEGLYVTLIWIFTAPILIIILFYIYVISGFVVDSDKEQIALLKSRGISFIEILRIYLYEGIILCSLGFIIGPILGFFISKGLSYISGFLDFDLGLEASKFSISIQAYVYSFVSAFIMLIILLASVYIASKNSIVQVKRSKKKYLMSILSNKNLDVILLGISLYGYYIYSKSAKASMFSKSNNVPVDPLLYLVSTIFIIGFGMFLIRLYKYFVRLLRFVGEKYMPTSYYLAITNVLRYHLSKGVIILFIIMTIALGFFDMKIAKNINTSTENTVKYSVGADLTIQQSWQKTVDESYSTGDDEQDNGQLLIYSEPPHSELSKVTGVESYTKVLNADGTGKIKVGDNTTIITSVMGIIPNEFGEIAWFDSNLLKFHWYNYLNIMTEKPNYILISSALSKSANFHKGDTISYRLSNGLDVRGVVLDIVDYWPGCGDLSHKNEIVGNFDFIFSKIPKYPYELWIKKASNVSNKTLYDSMNSKKLNITGYKDMSVELYKSKSDMFLKGTNAVLSLGIIAVTLVTIMGFLLYWIKALKNRKLSFGIYRSLGIASKKISLIIIIEQIHTLGFAILLGIIDGVITCKIFLPLVTELWYNSKYVLPVNRISYNGEYLCFGSILIAMFIISVFILQKYISKLKINEAIKLGEE